MSKRNFNRYQTMYVVPRWQMGDAQASASKPWKQRRLAPKPYCPGCKEQIVPDPTVIVPDPAFAVYDRATPEGRRGWWHRTCLERYRRWLMKRLPPMPEVASVPAIKPVVKPRRRRRRA